jgi:hypothetical protein
VEDGSPQGVATASSMTDVYTWTFMVQGDAIILDIPKQPPLYHVEGVTLWKFVGTETSAKRVKSVLVDAGLTATYRTEEVTPEMVAAPRPNIDEYSFRTTECPLCYFFDPGEVTLCGWESWPDERLEVAYGHPAAQNSIAGCPLHCGD